MHGPFYPLDISILLLFHVKHQKALASMIYKAILPPVDNGFEPSSDFLSDLQIQIFCFDTIILLTFDMALQCADGASLFQQQRSKIG